MEAAIERRGLLRSFLAPAPPSLAMEPLWSSPVEGTIERRGLLRSFLAPAPPLMRMERGALSRIETVIEALESTGMEAAFAVADGDHDRSAGVFRTWRPHSLARRTGQPPRDGLRLVAGQLGWMRL